MIFKNIHEFKKENFRNKAILAIDYGAKKLGAAISDKNQIISTPKDTYYRKDTNSDVNYINTLILSYDIKIIVLGLPLDLNGKYSQNTQKVKSFANLLNQEFPNIDFFFWDERFSTVQSHRILHSHSVSKEDSHKLNDAIAASIILSSFIEYKN